MNESESEIVQRFLALGEAAMVGRVYSAILGNGPITNEEIAAITNADFTQVGEAIQRLLLIPLLTTDINDEHRRVYYALPPHQAFEALETAARWQAEKVLSDAPSEATLSDKVRAHVDRFHTLSCELSDLAEQIYQHRSPVGFERITVARTKEQMGAFVSESVGRARAEIRAVVSPPHLLGPLVWVTVVSRMRDGVAYRRITILNEIFRHGFEITKREVKEAGVDLHFIEPEKIDQKFYVIDNEVVVFFNPGAAQGQFELTGQVVRNQELASRYVVEFERLREEGIVAEVVLEYVARARLRLLKEASLHLEEWEMTWLHHVIDYGVFNTLRLSPEQEKTVIDHVTAMDFVKFEHGIIIGNLDVDFAEIRTGRECRYSPVEEAPSR